MGNRLDRLLEPGQLLQGALAGDLLQQRLQFVELLPGQQLGAFKIEREIGRGGMGIVYLATRTDGAFEQHVAIKWLPIGRLDSLQAEQFRRERQIHAQLAHPHIARLLDGGRSHDGHLWFALDYVEGLPIDQHAAQQGMSWQARVQLLLPIIDAVQFAHSQLLVHRDIKPDNVLVNRHGEAKLIDFGVASMLRDTDVPAACTPGFSSPEQAAGDPVGTASDIWQLGHLLHCVLVASTPNLPAPRIPEDLHAIVLKAKQRLPSERYATAAALHADLQRLLHYRPVHARKTGPLHRIRLLLQAYPLGSALTGIAAFAFAATVTLFMLRITHERDAAREAQALTARVNAFLMEDFLPGADPLQGGSSGISVADLSEQALGRIEARLGNAPEVAAEIETSLGNILGNLGRFQAAQRAYTLSLNHLRKRYGNNDERVLRNRLNLIKARIDSDSLQTANASLTQLRQDILAAYGPHSALLMEADAYHARAAFLRDDFALCKQRYEALLPRLADATADEQAGIYIGLSLCESRLGNWESSIRYARQARDLNERRLGIDHPLSLETHIAIETALLGAGRYQESAQVSADLADKLATRYGNLHQTSLMIRHDQALALGCSGQPGRAIPLMQQTIAGRAKTLGPDHPWTAMSESVLGMLLIKDNKLAEAGRVLSKARSALGDNANDLPYIQLTLLQNEADLALAKHQFADAIARYGQAIAVAQTLYPETHRSVANLQLGLGLSLIGNGQAREGKQRIQHALPILGTRADCRSEMIARARSAVIHG